MPITDLKGRQSVNSNRFSGFIDKLNKFIQDQELFDLVANHGIQEQTTLTQQWKALHNKQCTLVRDGFGLCSRFLNFHEPRNEALKEALKEVLKEVKDFIETAPSESGKITNIQQTDKEGNTLLHLVARLEGPKVSEENGPKLELVQLLIEKGADLDQLKDSSNYTSETPRKILTERQYAPSSLQEKAAFLLRSIISKKRQKKKP